MNDPVATAELVRDLIGRRLLAVSEARYWHEGQRDDDAASLLDFWLHFEGKPALIAHGCSEHLGLEFVDRRLLTRSSPSWTPLFAVNPYLRRIGVS